MAVQSCFLLSLAFILTELGTAKISSEREELCETLPSEIHIIKEDFDEFGRLQRTCNGDISVNKCEGACNSQVQPSVITPTGFLKECYCCREGFLRERIITLTHCYDPDGIRLTEETNKSMDIKLNEPNDCKCSKCGDYSRYQMVKNGMRSSSVFNASDSSQECLCERWKFLQATYYLVYSNFPQANGKW